LLHPAGVPLSSQMPPAELRNAECKLQKANLKTTTRLSRSLGQALGNLHSYDRTRKAGRDAAVCLGLITDGRRVFVSEGKIRRKESKKTKDESEREE
jgi:hypothetical protein